MLETISLICLVVFTLSMLQSIFVILKTDNHYIDDEHHDDYDMYACVNCRELNNIFTILAKISLIMLIASGCGYLFFI